MTAFTYDPSAALPGPPDPWASTSAPSPTDGPPYHMTHMIEAEPALAIRIIERHASISSPAADLSRAIRKAVIANEPVLVTGCGTSEHAALGIVEILAEAVRAAGLKGRSGAPVRLPVGAQAFELALDPPSSGLVIGVSHEGATTATNAALDAARAAGAATAIITVSDRSPGAERVDIVVETGELDQSWCHTVGYLSPLAAATAMGAHLAKRPVDAALMSAVGDLLQAGLDRGSIAQTAADRRAGREFTLKIEEGTWIPAAYRDLETFLHGHLAATAPENGLVLILADRDRRPERLARAAGALRAARVIGMEAAAIVAADAAADLPTDLTPAGRIVLPEAPDLPAPVAALLGTAIPLQLLTERTARVRGVDPDPIHRDDDRYRDAADAAD